MSITSAGTSSTATTPAARPRTGPALVLILGSITTLIAHVVIGMAAVPALLSKGQRDPGILTIPSERYAVTSYALAIQHLEVVIGENPPFAGPAANAHVTLQVTPANPSQPIFIGVAPQADVSRYLDGVAYSEITQVKYPPFRPQYREIAGPNKPAPPGEQPFWTVSAQGSGPQQIEGDLRAGNWAIVVMNADGRAAVTVDLQAELDIDSSWFGETAAGLLVAGFVLWVIAAVLVLAGGATLFRRSS